MNLFQVFEHIGYLRNAKGEDALTNAIAVELKVLSLESRLNCLWFHVPNETVVQGQLDLMRIRKRHRMGMISGAPDFVFLADNKSVCVEIKTEKGVLSERQKLFRDWSENCKVPYYLVRSLSELKTVLEKEELLKKEE